ncbi:right-handed parallel beta-helix repeat-containing protein [Paenibacillus sp. GCM10027629]|uniref:right-handed parallel beta-helix repeat-containing protein n=1 Tax=Paenibacillus sp. GCM10027629 TaxID=3273414 RepID=UPI00363C5116
MSIHQGREFHVSMTGNDCWEGTSLAPLRTISAAAMMAQPGDVITVHEGVYRERISPPRGGESDSLRIIYQAASGERVEIKGSEIVKDWENVHENVWKTTIPNTIFGAFNPYNDLIKGDWFLPNERDHHTGSVYLNGDGLDEAAKLDDVLQNEGSALFWFASVDESNTMIWANFSSANPNEEFVEINVRQTVFYPEKPGVNYITVRGFIMRHAATPWAPPTAEQIGLVGTHWSKGWIIEHNTISHSRCTGITLGKYGDEWDNYDGTTESYHKTIERALENGWNSEQVGHHIVRSNTISYCGMAGIAGSLGAINSVVTENYIHDIHINCTFSGYEMAGIKFHGAIDTLISKNHIHRSVMGIWLDWMTQGTHVTGNLLYDNTQYDLFIEVSHGPCMVDHNLFLSGGAANALFNMSQGGAYAHNLFLGTILLKPELNRFTPYLHAHSTRVAGTHDIPGGDDRFYNNMFIGQGEPIGLDKFDEPAFPVFLDGNLYLNGAQPANHEMAPVQIDDFDPEVKLTVEKDGVYLHLKGQANWKNQRNRNLVTGELLGKTRITELPYEDVDGTPICLNKDYLGKSRDEYNPFPGPFEIIHDSMNVIKVWPGQ